MKVETKKRAGKPFPMVVGWLLRECLRIKPYDYLGLIVRTRKDRIGFWQDYAIVRAKDRRDLESGALCDLRAVHPKPGTSNLAQYNLSDAGAWTTSSERAYAKFRSVIATERKVIAAGPKRSPRHKGANAKPSTQAPAKVGRSRQLASENPHGEA